MRIILVTPPNTEEEFKNEFVRLLGVAKHLNIPLEPMGFAQAFQQDNMRLFVATEGDNNDVVGMSMMVFGTKFFDDEVTATAMFAEGKARTELLMHMRETSKIFRATHFIYESREGDTLGGMPSTVKLVKVL